MWDLLTDSTHAISFFPAPPSAALCAFGWASPGSRLENWSLVHTETKEQIETLVISALCRLGWLSHCLGRDEAFYFIGFIGHSMTVWTGWRDCVLELVRLSSYTIQKVAELLPIMHSNLGFLCVEQMCTLGEWSPWRSARRPWRSARRPWLEANPQNKALGWLSVCSHQWFLLHVSVFL